MKKPLKKLLFLAVLGTAMVSCKKDEQVTNLITSSPIVDGSINGSMKGKITGATAEDSTLFSVDYKNTIEYSWDYSWWQESNNQVLVAKTSGVNDEVDIYVERSRDDDWSSYSYIEIENWDTKGDIEDASIEFYIQQYAPLNNGRTLYYEQYVYEDDITVNAISFNRNTGKFKINLTAKVKEGDNNGTTGNPATITMSYEGILLSDDVTEKDSPK